VKHPGLPRGLDSLTRSFAHSPPPLGCPKPRSPSRRPRNNPHLLAEKPRLLPSRSLLLLLPPLPLLPSLPRCRLRRSHAPSCPPPPRPTRSIRRTHRLSRRSTFRPAKAQKPRGKQSRLLDQHRVKSLQASNHLLSPRYRQVDRVAVLQLRLLLRLRV